MRLPLTALLLLATSAVHAAPNSIELQLPASNVLDLVADRAKTSITCFDPFPIYETEVLVDHVEFPSPPSLRRSPDPQLVAINTQTGFAANTVQIVVPIQIFLKTRPQMEDPANAQNQYLLSPSTSVILDLGIQNTQLCATVNSLDPEVPMGELVLAELQQRIGQPCFPLDLEGLDDLLDNQVELTGRGVSASANFDRVAIRLEYDQPAGDTQAWINFISNADITPTNTTGFAVAFDKGLLARVLRERFREDAEAQPEIEEIEPPGVQSAWLYGLPFIQVYFDAQMDVMGCANTIGAHPITVDMQFGLSPNNDAVVVDGALDWSLVEGDMMLCGFTWAAFIGHYGVFLDGLAMGLLFGLTELLVEPDDDGLPAECTLIEGTRQFTCEYPLLMPELEAGGNSFRRTILSPNNLYVHGNSLVISGTASNTGVSGAAPKATITGGNLIYGIHGGCSNLHAGWEGHLVGSGYGALCEPLAIENDPQHVFFIDHIWEIYSSPFSQEIWFGGPNTETYKQNPYQADVTVWTSGGGRTVPIGPLDFPSDAEIWDLQNEYVMAQVNCMAKSTGLFGIPGKFDPRWKVDPPYDIVGIIRSSDPAWARRTARVSLERVSFETVGLRTRPQGEFVIPGQEISMTASARVDLGRDGVFQVEISTRFRSDLRGKELGETDIVSATFAERTMAAFQARSTSLPRAITSIDFSLDVSPPKLGMQGTLIEE